MKGTRTVAALALAALLVTAGCAGVVDSEPSDGANTGGGAAASAAERTVTVSASGQVSAQPDQAVLGLEVITTGEDVQTARQRLAANVSSMREALLAAGLNESQITTERYGIREDTIERRETGRTVYRAAHGFSVTLSDLDTVGEVIDTAVANGANNVDGVRFTLSEGRRGELREDALANAMESARSQADVVAERANLTLVGVSSASTVDTGYTPYYAESAALTAGDAGGASTSVSGGPVTVNAEVQVAYNATA